MPPPATETWSVSATKRWLHGLWEYYRSYTQTAVHAVSAAALTALGLLIFVNRFFVVLAIAAYICPPVILYSIDSDVGRPSDSSTAPPVQADSGTHSDTDSDEQAIFANGLENGIVVLLRRIISSGLLPLADPAR